MLEQACDLTTTEKLPNEDLVRLEKYIEEFSAVQVYTHGAMSKNRFTKDVRKSMTRNVKSSAYKNLLNPKNKDELKEHEGKFVDEAEEDHEQILNDTQILNFARDDLFKNASTNMPTRLFEPLSSYVRSIGQISCGSIRGTCWLVTDMLVITNHHVYMAMNTERIERQDPNLPITVSFDYLRPQQREHAVTVEIDEEQDPQLENPHLDYKFLRLQEDEGLNDRVWLGPIVRNRSLQEGLVIIVGYPGGKEMQAETCVVVRNHLWREQLEQRHTELQRMHQDPGLHMANEDMLRANRFQEQGCLPYDTTLFRGASGSPVFDLNGNIVAMHTQGYCLNVGGGQCSLMEFGVQFNAICEDLRSRNLVENYFPNYNLDRNQEPMDEGDNQEPMDEG